MNISEATYELVQGEPGLTFTPRGKVQAKGKGKLEMFFVRRSASSSTRSEKCTGKGAWKTSRN
ncbi:MAG: hypothetical protein IPG11_16130 [Flavobacteriales bacterium]|nr:hypothetical protein [Flavobacteriales bacterium]